MSKGKQEMEKTITTRQLQMGDKFKIPGNTSQTYEVVNIKDDYLIYRNVRSHEEFQMVRGFASKVDLVEESADYQKKWFKEPYYMYNESKKVVENKMVGIISLPVGSKFIDDSFGGKRTLEVVKHGNDDVIHVKEVGTGRKFAYDASTPGGNKKVEKIEEGYGFINESSETKKDYLKYIDQFEKDVKKYIDWMKRDVKENKEIVLPDVVVSLATAITNAMNRYNNAVKTKTLTESFIIQDSDSNNKPVYFHYGKYTGYDWGFDKNAATKFSTKEAADRMIEKMRQEGMLINSMKVVSEGRIAKGYENLDADEKARHLLSHPSSKYMNDLKSENITERAIRKAVKEMLGKPDKRDPQFIIDVNEEGEAPAIANTTAEVANPDLPLKLKEAQDEDYVVKQVCLYAKPDVMKSKGVTPEILATAISDYIATAPTSSDIFNVNFFAKILDKVLASGKVNPNKFILQKVKSNCSKLFEDEEKLENSIKYQTSVAGGMGTDAENAPSAKEYEDEVSLIKEHRSLRKFIKESK